MEQKLFDMMLKMDEKLNKIDGRLDNMDRRFDNIDERLVVMDNRFDSIITRLDVMDKGNRDRFDTLANQLHNTQNIKKLYSEEALKAVEAV